MGQSFEHASRKKSLGDFSKQHTVYDKDLDFYYSPSWSNDSLYITEFRLEGKDTTHILRQKINYIVGSGQHTNSHLFIENGYLFQAPLTYYSQKGRWDLPPGFEKGQSNRFSRMIGLECMSCHNGYPKMVQGSENKYLSLPNGIDCERCHGPGEIHVAEKQKGNLVDTSKVIDYTIVNPGKLPVDLQFDLCQRCHLQGNTVLKEGKSFFDFKPGMHLSDVMQVYLPRYEGDEQSFIMASHADRLKQSACFSVMEKKAANMQALRPYKNALTCVTCHNPHVSVKETSKDHFNQTCQSCHAGNKQQKQCSEKENLRLKAENNCVSCHMPLSGSIDIPHVRIHDHYIRKQPQVGNVSEKGKFKGLSCINDRKASSSDRARAYLQQFEKFESDHTYLLDSAEVLLKAQGASANRTNFHWLVQLYYLRQQFDRVVQLAESIGFAVLQKEVLKQKSWANQDAWTSYRIGESYATLGDVRTAFQYYKIAWDLAPYNYTFGNKYATAAMQNGELTKAKSVFTNIAKEVPGFAPAWSNLGYLFLTEGDAITAERYYKKAISLDPDYSAAWLNMAGLHVYKGEDDKARAILTKMLKKEPANLQVKQILNQLEH
jgi:tetratricopeptide (TPR) repeat protein